MPKLNAKKKVNVKNKAKAAKSKAQQKKKVSTKVVNNKKTAQKKKPVVKKKDVNNKIKKKVVKKPASKSKPAKKTVTKKNIVAKKKIKAIVKKQVKNKAKNSMKKVQKAKPIEKKKKIIPVNKIKETEIKKKPENKIKSEIVKEIEQKSFNHDTLRSLNKKKIIEAYKKTKESMQQKNIEKPIEIGNKIKPLIAPSKTYKNISELPKIAASYAPKENEDYMNPNMLAFFANKLLEWKEELLEQSRSTMENLKQESKTSPDPNDQATDEMNRTLELRARDRYRKLIHKIDKALDRILSGEYGYCEDTGDEIGIKRLIARPIATLTIEAQEKHENYERSHIDED